MDQIENVTSIDNSSLFYYGWHDESPIDCNLLKFVGIICIGILTLSITFNSLILIAFKRQKKITHTYEYLIIALSILNLTG